MLLKVDPAHPAGGIDSPFRVRFYDDVIEPSLYQRLLASWPAIELMRPIGAAGNKLCFNDREGNFGDFLDANADWKVFYTEIKTRFSELCSAAVGVKGGKRARFEFSWLPGIDGGLHPHPDTKKKIATAVIYMEPDWDPSWGGGFEALRHLTTPDADFTDLRPGWDEVETVLTVPLKPRRMLFMQRTNNSLHGVRPTMSPRPRRSLTVNLIG